MLCRSKDLFTVFVNVAGADIMVLSKFSPPSALKFSTKNHIAASPWRSMIISSSFFLLFVIAHMLENNSAPAPNV
jgi:hypothetical protein